MFGPRRCRNTRAYRCPTAGQLFYWNKCKVHTQPDALASPSRVAPHELQALLGARPARNCSPSARYNAFMVYASMSRLHQGCVLLSGFAPKKETSHSERSAASHVTRNKSASCATALYDLSFF